MAVLSRVEDCEDEVFRVDLEAQEKQQRALWRGKPFGFRIVAVTALLFGAAYLLGQPMLVSAVRAQELSTSWLLVLPISFSTFVCALVVYVIVNSVKKGFFTGNSLIQIGIAVVLFSLVNTSTWSEYRARTIHRAEGNPSLMSLSTSRDARVRRLVMEVCGHRVPLKPDLLQILKRGLADKDPMVQQAAIKAIEKQSKIVFPAEEALQQAHSWLTQHIRMSKKSQ